MLGSKLLIHEPMRAALPSLCHALGGGNTGTVQAMILQQIHFWCYMIEETGAGEEQDGFFWIRKSYTDIHKAFDWLAKKTIRRHIEALREQGVLIARAFDARDGDRTLSYRIDYDRLELLERRVSAKRRAAKASGQTDQKGCGQIDQKGCGQSDHMPREGAVGEGACGQTDQTHVDSLTTSPVIERSTDHHEEEYKYTNDDGDDLPPPLLVDTQWFRLEVEKHLPINANVATVNTEAERDRLLYVMRNFNQQQIEEALRITSSTANRPCWSYFVKVLESDEKAEAAEELSVEEYNRRQREAYDDDPFLPVDDQTAPKREKLSEEDQKALLGGDSFDELFGG